MVIRRGAATPAEPATPDTVAPSSPAGARARRGGRRARRRGDSPSVRPVAGRVAEPRHRNPTWVLAGVLLVIVSALGGVLLFTAQDDRVEVLVAARDLAPGEVVERSDLRIERLAIDGDVASIGPTRSDEVVGRYVLGSVPTGTLLNPAMFSADSGLDPGEMELGAALDPGEFPQSAIPLGATVELLSATPAEPGPSTADGSATARGDEPAGGGPAPATSLGTGRVTGAEERANGQLLVTVRAARDVGLVATQAAQDDTLRIVLVEEP